MTIRKIGVLGSGTVGQTLADGFLSHGYEVSRGSRDPAKLRVWLEGAGERAHVGTFAEAAAFGEVVVLAVKGEGALAAAEQAGAGLDGKPVIDTQNPIDDSKPPVDGVLSFFTGPNESLLELLQQAHPKARFVKAFSMVGSGRMIDPDFGGTKPTMFICGDDADAKAQVRGLIEQVGWEVADFGAARAARAIEPLCIAWCIPGFRDGSWGHAFKLLR